MGATCGRQSARASGRLELAAPAGGPPRPRRSITAGPPPLELRLAGVGREKGPSLLAGRSIKWPKLKPGNHFQASTLELSAHCAYLAAISALGGRERKQAARAENLSRPRVAIVNWR